MIRATWHRFRRIRPHTLFLLLIITLVIYCLQLPDSLAEHPEHSTGHHRGILVTTPTNQSYPLHYLSLDSIHGSLDATPVAASLGGGRQSVSHLVGHPRRYNLFYVNNEVTPGSIFTGTIRGMRNESDLSLDSYGHTPSQGNEPAYSLVTRDGQHLIVINVCSASYDLTLLTRSMAHRPSLSIVWRQEADFSFDRHSIYHAQHGTIKRLFLIRIISLSTLAIQGHSTSRI
jgi:6-phosphogluconolactonase (cycloisomerase 2 family)